MKAQKSVFVCSGCGYQTAKWLGKCPSCGEWNSFDEVVQRAESGTKRTAIASSEAMLFDELELPDYMRSETGIGELDRVLGGGLVSGSAVLLSGEPGIGKSTLLMQISGCLSPKSRVLYASGEESGAQLKMRAKRLGICTENIYVQTETNINAILAEADKHSPDVMVIDSIQTMYDDALSSSPGSITQVKECAAKLINKAKNDSISVLIVSHVNKEGSIAGPKVLEHAVDAVLYFEGERRGTNRIIRAVKNRFGSTNEIGVFEMSSTGLKEIPNPSEAMLADRPRNVSGSCALCVIEGTRPIIAEVQALTSQSYLPSPRRTADGLDYNRVGLLLAVLEKRLGLRFSQQDVFVNVIGGLTIDEPSSDLALVMSLISALKDIPLPDDLIAMGEIGLAGEVRAIPQTEQRISEAVRLGFKTIVIPKRNYTDSMKNIKDIRIVPVKSVIDVISKSNNIF